MWDKSHQVDINLLRWNLIFHSLKMLHATPPNLSIRWYKIRNQDNIIIKDILLLKMLWKPNYLLTEKSVCNDYAQLY